MKKDKKDVAGASALRKKAEEALGDRWKEGKDFSSLSPEEKERVY
jgi:hypothetical protein